MIENLKQFFREVKAELKKVVFPSRDDLVGSTWVVLVSVFFVAVFLGVLDMGLSKIVQALLR